MRFFGFCQLETQTVIFRRLLRFLIALLNLSCVAIHIWFLRIVHRELTFVSPAAAAQTPDSSAVATLLSSSVIRTNCTRRLLQWVNVLICTWTITKCALVCAFAFHSVGERETSRFLRVMSTSFHWVLPFGLGFKLFWQLSGTVILLDTQLCLTGDSLYDVAVPTPSRHQPLSFDSCLLWRTRVYWMVALVTHLAGLVLLFCVLALGKTPLRSSRVVSRSLINRDINFDYTLRPRYAVHQRLVKRRVIRINPEDLPSCSYNTLLKQTRVNNDCLLTSPPSTPHLCRSVSMLQNPTTPILPQTCESSISRNESCAESVKAGNASASTRPHNAGKTNASFFLPSKSVTLSESERSSKSDHSNRCNTLKDFEATGFLRCADTASYNAATFSTNNAGLEAPCTVITFSRSAPAQSPASLTSDPRSLTERSAVSDSYATEQNGSRALSNATYVHSSRAPRYQNVFDKHSAFCQTHPRGVAHHRRRVSSSRQRHNVTRLAGGPSSFPYVDAFPKRYFLTAVIFDVIATLTDLPSVAMYCNTYSYHLAELECANTLLHRLSTWHCSNCVARFRSVVSQQIMPTPRWCATLCNCARRRENKKCLNHSLRSCSMKTPTARTPPPTANREKQLKACLEAAITEEPQCCICCTDYGLSDTVTLLPCPSRHYFHSRCAAEWLGQHPTCPLCRHLITTCSFP